MNGRSLAGRAVALGRFLELQNLGLNLPFLLGFLWVAAHGAPTVRAAILLVLAYVAARNAGHSFNRWSDRALDARNPRTADRLLVRRPELAPAALAFAGANGLVVALCAYWLNPVALLLVPVALGLVLGYSLTKRFTSATTLFLGLVEAITPAAVYIALFGNLPVVGAVAALGMFAWGTAFEIVHSLGDLRSDAELGLHSLPRRLGPTLSRYALAAFQSLALASFVAYGLLAGLHAGYFLVLGGIALGLGAVDVRVARSPEDARAPFRWHFVLAAGFLVAALVGFVG